MGCRSLHKSDGTESAFQMVVEYVLRRRRMCGDLLKQRQRSFRADRFQDRGKAWDDTLSLTSRFGCENCAWDKENA